MSDCEKSGENEFSEYRRLIMADLKRLEENDADILAKLALINQSIVELKVKAALAGAIAGLIGSIIVGWFIKKL